MSDFIINERKVSQEAWDQFVAVLEVSGKEADEIAIDSNITTDEFDHFAEGDIRKTFPIISYGELAVFQIRYGLPSLGNPLMRDSGAVPKRDDEEVSPISGLTEWFLRNWLGVLAADIALIGVLAGKLLFFNRKQEKVKDGPGDDDPKPPSGPGRGRQGNGVQETLRPDGNGTDSTATNVDGGTVNSLDDAAPDENQSPQVMMNSIQPDYEGAEQEYIDHPEWAGPAAKDNIIALLVVATLLLGPEILLAAPEAAAVGGTAATGTVAGTALTTAPEWLTVGVTVANDVLPWAAAAGIGSLAIGSLISGSNDDPAAQ